MKRLTPGLPTPFDPTVLHDLVVFVPLGSEDVVLGVVETLGRSRVLMDPEDPEEFRYDENDNSTIRLGRGVDPNAYARELTRRVLGLQLVATVPLAKPSEQGDSQ